MKKKYSVGWRPLRSRFIFVLLVIWRWLKGRPGLLYAPGVHLMTGPMGAGKTLLANIIINETVKSSGFCWVNIDEFASRRVKVFDLDAVFKDGDQKFRLNKTLPFYPTKEEMDRGAKMSIQRCKALFIDELNARFNRRNNRQTDYNDVFIPLVKFIVTGRHQLCDRFYLLGQSLLLQDGQIQAIIKYRHDIRASKRWRYYWFREFGKMVYLPKKLIITHYLNTAVDGMGNITWTELRQKGKIKVRPSDLLSYDTHAFAKLFDGLPEYSK